MSDFRIEIGFDWNGNFLPSDVVRLQGEKGPSFASQYLFRLPLGRAPSTVQFWVYDITRRVDEVLGASAPPPDDPVPQRLEVELTPARSAQARSGATPLAHSPFPEGVPNPLVLETFHEPPDQRHPSSCAFGKLTSKEVPHDKRVLAGWIALPRSGTQVEEGMFPLSTPGAFLVSYTLSVRAGEEERTFSTDPEWIVGGGEEPDPDIDPYVGPTRRGGNRHPRAEGSRGLP